MESLGRQLESACSWLWGSSARQPTRRSSPPLPSPPVSAEPSASRAPSATALLVSTLAPEAPALASDGRGADPLGLRSVKRRPLGGTERHFAAQHKIAGVQQIATLATLDPAPEPEAVCAAAGALQALHPELRAAIVEDSDYDDVFLDCRAGGPVEVRIYEGSAEGALNAELHSRLDPGVCGWRVAVCGPHVLLTYHHTFLDGRGIMVVLEDLLDLLAGHTPPPPAGGGGGLAPLFEEDVPWPRPQPHTEPHLVLDPPKCLAARPEREVPTAERRQRFLCRALPSEFVQRLLVRCRECGSSAQGALAAATALALAAAYGCRGLRLLVGIDCRKACNRGPRSLACCAQSLSCMLRADRPFWEIAKEHKQELLRRMEVYEHLPVYPRPVRLRSWKEVQAAARWQLRERGERPLVQFSNRGAYRLSTPTHKATKVHFAQLGAPDPRHALFFVNVCTVGGEMCLTLCFDTPACSEEKASQVADGIVGELQASLGAPLPPVLRSSAAAEGAREEEDEEATWRVERGRLPEEEGLGMQPVPNFVPNVAAARRLAERSPYCVGFCYLETANAFYFKQRNSGFDVSTSYVDRPGFQWHYILERSAVQ